MNKFKQNDKIILVQKSCNSVTLGKEYIVIGEHYPLDWRISIINDNGYKIMMHIDFFVSKKEHRKIKLEKIRNV